MKFRWNDIPKPNNNQPLAYMALAAQKNYNAFYMMCVYQDEKLLEFLKKSYHESGKKLDMGKSCLRFRQVDDLHLNALAKIISSTPPEAYIKAYEQARGN